MEQITIPAPLYAQGDKVYRLTLSRTISTVTGVILNDIIVGLSWVASAADPALGYWDYLIQTEGESDVISCMESEIMTQVTVTTAVAQELADYFSERENA